MAVGRISSPKNPAAAPGGVGGNGPSCLLLLPPAPASCLTQHCLPLPLLWLWLWLWLLASGLLLALPVCRL
jgi:hypothetical protein